MKVLIWLYIYIYIGAQDKQNLPMLKCNYYLFAVWWHREMRNRAYSSEILICWITFVNKIKMGSTALGIWVFAFFYFFLTLVHWTWSKLNEDVTTSSTKFVTGNELTVRMRPGVSTVCPYLTFYFILNLTVHRELRTTI